MSQAAGGCVVDSRYTFTFQFLVAADFFSKEAARIETLDATTIGERDRAHHRAFVVGAIMQASAALDAEAYEVSHHGPGSYLGGVGKSDDAKFLEPMCDVLDERSVLERFDLVLHLLKKPPLDHGAKPYQDVANIVRLRNELVHHKSRLGREMEDLKFIRALRELRHKRPPFVHESSNFFPHHALSASCARWATDSTIEYIRAFHTKLGYPDYVDRFLAPQMARNG